MDKDPGIGKLVDLYWRLARNPNLSEDLEKLRLDTLDDLLENLGSSFRDIASDLRMEDTEDVLQDLTNAVENDNPEELERGFRQLRRPQRYRFEIPFCRVQDIPFDLDFGGRYALSLAAGGDTVAVMPSDPSDLEKAQIANGTGGDVIRARLETVRRVFVSGGDRGKRLRIAARFLQKACGSDQDGDAHLFLAICLEGLLIDKSQGGDTARRLSDAAGFLLGRSQPEREELRNQAAYLYKVRSGYVHEGNYQGSEKGRRESLRLAGRVLAHEMRILE